MRQKTHIVGGGVVGAAASIVRQSILCSLDPNYRFDWGQVVCWAGIGMVVATIPDILEPALHPNHRGPFHSVAFGFAVLWLTSGKHCAKLGPMEQSLLAMVGQAYASHLGLDAITPKGLPLC